MSDIVIKAENIGKKYIIGHQSQKAGYTALRDVWMQNARTIWSKTKDLATGKPIIQGDTTEEVWALKDVSFGIHRGETVGIIGRNGAGKSTLLKILSRITEPSTGRVPIKDRVASLLEVGTGFHPELTGRENIYLNGTILGMTRKEIKKKFDEIVTFAEVEKYLDTPVKRYSSGMYVRLAFAVAAHLEPEILVVDEVLAVGDAQFQKKCLGKMGDVAKEGRTVLFVSHNIGAIKTLCQKGIYLQDGHIEFIGDVNDAISSYLNSNQGHQTPEIILEECLHNIAQILSVSVMDENNILAKIHPYSLPFFIKIKVRIYSKIVNGYIAIHIKDNESQTIIFSRKFLNMADEDCSCLPGIYGYSVKIPAPLLIPGNYTVSVHFVSGIYPELTDGVDDVCSFELVDSGSKDTKEVLPWRGKLSIPLSWDIIMYDNEVKC
jgi:lipopolysaccharide transport system ATP-binding protein